MGDYARSLVKQYDKNGNMMLEADERKELKGKPAAADLNKDNVITVDELVDHLSGGASPTSATSATPTTAAAGGTSAGNSDRAGGDSPGGVASPRVFTGTAGGTSAASAADKRRSYRFTPAVERLPAGLPDWFQSRDRNGDGQVAMSEYSRSWSARTVAEFRRFDLNDDGIITPKEVAQ